MTAPAAMTASRMPVSDPRRPPRRHWTAAEARAIHDLPFMELLFQAQTVHRQHFDPNRVQLSRLLSIKTGGCPEDCTYCSQSARYDSGLSASKLMEVQRVIAEAAKAKAAGATRYCMGAAWRSPKERDMPQVLAMVEGVKALGMETCMTLGMLDAGQAARLKAAGLDYYNHNVDTSEAHYSNVITTRSYADRLDTVEGQVHAARRAAEVIAAVPSTSWPVHLTHVVTRTGIAPDIALSEVFDAAHARTKNGRVPAGVVPAGCPPEPDWDAVAEPSVSEVSAAETGSGSLAGSAQAVQRAASVGRHPLLPTRPATRHRL